LLRDLSREAFLQPSRDIDLHELILFKSRVSRQFTLLADKIGMFGIGLRAYRDIFARSHRHGSGHKPGDTRQQDIRPRCGSGCNAQDQAGSRNDPVIGTKHGGPEPSDAFDGMAFHMQAAHPYHSNPSYPLSEITSCDPVWPSEQTFGAGTNISVHVPQALAVAQNNSHR